MARIVRRVIVIELQLQTTFTKHKTEINNPPFSQKSICNLWKVRQGAIAKVFLNAAKQQNTIQVLNSIDQIEHKNV